ncbi:PQQ-binding-like beta-propeller repeat protein [Kitasatospora sp. NPDC094019]|uniref:outer membrane protein assembly factor BamB family protein n=1 Tax=Kitasatospora sp. NPDC094019 TaxID=3364091 RepID=UPI0037F43D1A
MTDVASGIVGTTGRAVAEAAGEAVRRRLSSEPDGRAAVAAFDSGPQEPAAQAELCRVLVQVMSTEPQFAVQLTALVPVAAPTAPVPPLPPAPPPPAEPPRIGRDGIIIDGRSRNTGNLALGDQLIQNIRRGDPRTVLFLILALALVVALGYGGTKIVTDDTPDPPSGSLSAPFGASAQADPESSGGDQSATTRPSPSPSVRTRPEPVRADPPVRFTPAAHTLFRADDDRQVVLDGLDLVLVEDGRALVSRDVRDGRLLAQMTSTGVLRTREPNEPSKKRLGYGRPAVGAAGGRRVAVAVFPLTIVGRGTVTDHYGVEVDILDLDSGKEAGRVTIDDGTVAGDIATVAGVAAGRAVVVVPSLSGPPTSYAIDLATGAVTWKLANFAAQLIQDGTVLGVSSTTGRWSTGPYDSVPLEARAASVTDGTVLWSALNGEASDLSMFAADKILTTTGKLLSTATGTLVSLPALPGKRTSIRNCWFDGRATTVCRTTSEDGGWLIGIDAATTAVLWQINSSATTPGVRLAPTVTGAWHGVVYGRTQKGEAVVLDARTGQDRELAPGAAPDQINEYAALVENSVYLSAG